MEKLAPVSSTSSSDPPATPTTPLSPSTTATSSVYPSSFTGSSARKNSIGETASLKSTSSFTSSQLKEAVRSPFANMKHNVCPLTSKAKRLDQSATAGLSSVSSAELDSQDVEYTEEQGISALEELAKDLTQRNLLPSVRTAYLHTLKLLSRQKTSSFLAEPSAIQTLCGHTFSPLSPTSSREALRTLANILFHFPPARQTVVDKGFGRLAAERYSSSGLETNGDCKIEDEFLLGRVLFLCTYDTNLDFAALLEPVVAPKTRKSFGPFSGSKDKDLEKDELSSLPDDASMRSSIKSGRSSFSYADSIQTLGSGTPGAGLQDGIINAISRHARLYSRRLGLNLVCPIMGIPKDPMQDMALAETLKLLFNITHYLPDKAEDFEKVVENILKILARRKLLPTPHSVLTSPVNYLINALVNLPLKEKTVFPSKCEYGQVNVNRLIEILDRLATVDQIPKTSKKQKTTFGTADLEFDVNGSPLLTVLRRFYGVAPESGRKHMQKLLLPKDEDRDQPLGKGTNLPARLLQISTSALHPAVRENISALLFELSDQSPADFIRNVGFGFASGFLVTKGLKMPTNADGVVTPDSDYALGRRDSVVTIGGDRIPGNRPKNPRDQPFNFITGQRLDAEQKLRDMEKEEKEMSQEEKEMEAERLYVLFERLKATGVMDVKNPVQEAIETGRFEELD